MLLVMESNFDIIFQSVAHIKPTGAGRTLCGGRSAKVEQREGGAICVALTSGNTDKVLSSPEGEDEFYDVARQLYASPQQSHKVRQPATAT